MKAKPAPAIVNGQVTPPRRVRYADLRPREYLTPDEVERLMTMACTRPGRNSHRDQTLILVAYRHGLRVSELVALRWDSHATPDRCAQPAGAGSTRRAMSQTNPASSRAIAVVTLGSGLPAALIRRKHPSAECGLAVIA